MAKKAEKKIDTRETLLNTAIELIWQSNYASVGVSEICEQAGVTKGGFYHYFESKAELFHAASLHHWEKMKHALNTIFSPEHDSLTQLESWIDFIIEKQETNRHHGNQVAGCPFFTAGAQCGAEEQKIRETAVEMAEKVLRYNTALIRSLQDDGHLMETGQPAQIGRMLTHYVQGLLLYGRIHNDLGIVITDLREGIYRLISLKPTLRHKPIEFA